MVCRLGRSLSRVVIYLFFFHPLRHLFYLHHRGRQSQYCHPLPLPFLSLTITYNRNINSVCVCVCVCLCVCVGGRCCKGSTACSWCTVGNDKGGVRSGLCSHAHGGAVTGWVGRCCSGGRHTEEREDKGTGKGTKRKMYRRRSLKYISHLYL